MGCHFLLQEVFLTQGSNSGLLCHLHWQVDSLPLLPSWEVLANIISTVSYLSFSLAFSLTKSESTDYKVSVFYIFPFIYSCLYVLIGPNACVVWILLEFESMYLFCRIVCLSPPLILSSGRAERTLLLAVTSLAQGLGHSLYFINVVGTCAQWRKSCLTFPLFS